MALETMEAERDGREIGVRTRVGDRRPGRRESVVDETVRDVLFDDDDDDDSGTDNK